MFFLEDSCLHELMFTMKPSWMTGFNFLQGAMNRLISCNKCILLIILNASDDLIFYRWDQASQVSQPVLEARQNLEARVVRWALEDLCLQLLRKKKHDSQASKAEFKDQLIPKTM